MNYFFSTIRFKLKDEYYIQLLISGTLISQITLLYQRILFGHIAKF